MNRSCLAQSGESDRRASPIPPIGSRIAESGERIPRRESYLGGKGQDGVWQRIISAMPPHRVYVEAFAGSGIIALKKRPASRTVLIDRNCSILAKIDDGGRAEKVCGDAVEWLREQSWQGDELVYCDPPYLFAVRSSKGTRYPFDMGAPGQHRRLLRCLMGLPCMVLVSHYPHPIYDEGLSGWRVQSYQAGTRGGPRTEGLWANFPEPLALHDYRWLGRDFRERERINRRIARQAARLLAMPPLERAAVIAAAASLIPASAARS